MKRIRFCAVLLLALALAAGIATVVGLHATNVSPPAVSQSPPVVQGEIMNNPDPILYGENAGAPLEYFVSPQRASPCKLLAVRIISPPDDTHHRGAMNGSPTRVKNLPDLFGHKIGATIIFDTGKDMAYKAATAGGS